MDSIIQVLDNMQLVSNDKTSTYYNQEGIKVPRVTEILSRTIHSDRLMYWANSIGLKGERYRDVLNRAATAGTQAHNAIEIYLSENIKTNDNTPFLGFLMWYNYITQDVGLPIEVIYIEHKLVCKYFGGTLDLLVRIGNKVYLLDFKTSNHVTFNYFLQLAAYRYMLREVENINVDGVIVLQLDKDEPGFNEYHLSFDYPDHLTFMDNCQTAFLSLVFAFYNIQSIEGQFNNLFRGD